MSSEIRPFEEKQYILEEAVAEKGFEYRYGRDEESMCREENVQNNVVAQSYREESVMDESDNLQQITCHLQGKSAENRTIDRRYDEKQVIYT